MQRHLSELESALGQLISEHRKLLQYVEAHQLAMKAVDLKAMDCAAALQEAARLRIATVENKRRALTLLVGRALALPGEPTLSRIVAALPAGTGVNLLPLGQELRTTILEVASRTHVAGKLAGAVLGHLNTVVRIFAAAVHQAGTYSKTGIPQVTQRIGVMEAIA